MDTNPAGGPAACRAPSVVWGTIGQAAAVDAPGASKRREGKEAKMAGVSPGERLIAEALGAVAQNLVEMIKVLNEAAQDLRLIRAELEQQQVRERRAVI